MGMPVVTVASGGMPVVDVTATTGRGIPVTEATNKSGCAVTKVTSGGMPVAYETIGVSAGFATFDGIPTTANTIMSNGNLTVTNNNSNVSAQVSSTVFKTSGKYYFEIKFGQKSSGTGHSLGVVLTTATSGDLNNGTKCVAVLPATASFIYSNNVSTGKDLGTAASNDVYGFAIDLTNRLAWIRKGAGNWNADVAANPVTGTNGVTIAAGSFAPSAYLSINGLNDSVTANFGATAYANAAPAGFSGWPGA